jgi:hypothetical protein
MADLPFADDALGDGIRRAILARAEGLILSCPYARDMIQS